MNTQAPVQLAPANATLHQRVRALMALVVNDYLLPLLMESDFARPFKKAIGNLGGQFMGMIDKQLAKMTEEELAAQIRFVRDEIIPFLLPPEMGPGGPDENRNSHG